MSAHIKPKPSNYLLTKVKSPGNRLDQYSVTKELAHGDVRLHFALLSRHLRAADTSNVDKYLVELLVVSPTLVEQGRNLERVAKFYDQSVEQLKEKRLLLCARLVHYGFAGVIWTKAGGCRLALEVAARQFLRFWGRTRVDELLGEPVNAWQTGWDLVKGTDVTTLTARGVRYGEKLRKRKL